MGLHLATSGSIAAGPDPPAESSDVPPAGGSEEIIGAAGEMRGSLVPPLAAPARQAVVGRASRGRRATVRRVAAQRQAAADLAGEDGLAAASGGAIVIEVEGSDDEESSEPDPPLTGGGTGMGLEVSDEEDSSEVEVVDLTQGLQAPTWPTWPTTSSTVAIEDDAAHVRGLSTTFAQLFTEPHRIPQSAALQASGERLPSKRKHGRDCRPCKFAAIANPQRPCMDGAACEYCHDSSHKGSWTYSSVRCGFRREREWPAASSQAFESEMVGGGGNAFVETEEEHRSAAGRGRPIPAWQSIQGRQAQGAAETLSPAAPGGLAEEVAKMSGGGVFPPAQVNTAGRGRPVPAWLLAQGDGELRVSPAPCLGASAGRGRPIPAWKAVQAFQAQGPENFESQNQGPFVSDPRAVEGVSPPTAQLEGASCFARFGGENAFIETELLRTDWSGDEEAPVLPEPMAQKQPAIPSGFDTHEPEGAPTQSDVLEQSEAPLLRGFRQFGGVGIGDANRAIYEYVDSRCIQCASGRGHMRPGSLCEMCFELALADQGTDCCATGSTPRDHGNQSPPSPDDIHVPSVCPWNSEAVQDLQRVLRAWAETPIGKNRWQASPSPEVGRMGGVEAPLSRGVSPRGVREVESPRTPTPSPRNEERQVCSRQRCYRDVQPGQECHNPDERPQVHSEECQNRWNRREVWIRAQCGVQWPPCVNCQRAFTCASQIRAPRRPPPAAAEGGNRRRGVMTVSFSALISAQISAQMFQRLEAGDVPASIAAQVPIDICFDHDDFVSVTLLSAQELDQYSAQIAANIVEAIVARFGQGQVESIPLEQVKMAGRRRSARRRPQRRMSRSGRPRQTVSGSRRRSHIRKVRRR